MRSTPLEQKLEALSAPVIEDLGYAMIQIKVKGQGNTTIVEVMAEDPSTGRLPIEACADISRQLSAVYDVADPLKDAYRLEVTSPGIDRPLVRLVDFQTFIGFAMKLELDEAADSGQKRFSGKVTSVEGETIHLETEAGEVAIPYGSIHKAKLVFNDMLLQATQASWPPVPLSEDEIVKNTKKPVKRPAQRKA